MNTHALIQARAAVHLEQPLRELVPQLEVGPPDELLEAARERARAQFRSAARTGGGEDMAAALAHLAEVVNRLALRDDVDPEAIGTLVETVTEESRLEPAFLRLEACTRALRDPSLLARLPRVAVPAQLRVVSALTGAADVSLWTRTDEGALDLVWSLEESVAGDSRPAAARGALRGGVAVTDGFVSVPVMRGGRPAAALVVRAPGEAREWMLRLMTEAAATLGLLLERESLLRRNQEQERSLVQSSERRLVRLGFDLHDGAIQDIAALAGDVRLFREQVGAIVGGHEHEAVILGRIEDLLSRLYSLDGDLRRLVRSVETPTIASRPLEDVLRDEVELFRSRAEIDVALDVEGDFADLTASQRIALLRVIQEALANVREHSGAASVELSVVRRGGYVHGEVRDDGSGFDVEQTLTDAARRGRLGLLGMSERVRLLGGMFDIESRSGGPTSILVTLPEWRPVTDRPAGRLGSGRA